MIAKLRYLILGGTAEARALADRLNKSSGIECITSFAGRTDNPVLPDGKTRIGGFGGVEGLTIYLKDQKITCLIDATHPFAARISKNAFAAARCSGIEIVRLERPPWQATKDDQWHHVSSLEEAVLALPEASSALVTIGRQQLGAFLDREDVRVIARAIEAPKIAVPAHWQVVLARPPFTLDQELTLFKQYDVDVLVTKNAGGSETREKLLAARALKKPVIIVDRLPKPDVPSFETIEALLTWLRGA